MYILPLLVSSMHNNSMNGFMLLSFSRNTYYKVKPNICQGNGQWYIALSPAA